MQKEEYDNIDDLSSKTEAKLSENSPLLKQSIISCWAQLRLNSSEFKQQISAILNSMGSLHFSLPHIHCALPTMTLTLPNKRTIMIGLVSVPAVMDGIGYGAVSFSQLLTTAYSLNLMTPDPSHLRQTRYLGPLLLLPFFAGVGVGALSIHENKELVDEQLSKARDEEVSKYLIVKENIKKTLKLLKKHPVETICLTVAATVEGIVIYSNLGYTANQLGKRYKDSFLFYPSTILSVIIALQSLALNGPNLIELVEKGYSVPKYTNKRRYRLLQFVAAGLVNALPILSAATVGALGSSECYELTQYILKQVDKEDIANRLAWLPAFALGMLYFACHFALYGREFKLFLSNKVRSLNEEGLVDFFKLNVVPSLDNKWRKLFLYPSVLLISAAAMVIGFGALDELSYIAAYSEPPAVPTSNSSNPPLMSLKQKLLFYSFPSLALGLETYAVEGRKVLALFKLINEEEDNRYRNLAELSEIFTRQKKSYYSIKQFLPDILSVVLIGGVKFMIDWFYMPDSVSANEVTLKDNVLIAVVVGLMAMGRYGIINAYNNVHYHKHLQMQNDYYRSLIEKQLRASRNGNINAELDKYIENKPEEASDNEISSLSENTEHKYDENIFDDPKVTSYTEAPPLSRGQLIKNLAIIGLVATGVTMGSELLTRSGILNHVEKNEEMDRVNNGQILGALAGGLAGVYAVPCFNLLKSKITSGYQSCYNFFKSSKPNTEYIPNTSLNSNAVSERLQF